VFLFALLACTSPDSAEDFSGGSFQFTTTGVTDGCLDGAFDTLLMPDGTATDWANPVELPAHDALPSTYMISIQDPYGQIEVTVTEGEEHTLEVAGAEATDVEFDADTYPGCLIDNSIDVSLTIVDADNLQGTAVLHTSGFTAEEGCPTAPETCDVTMDLLAARIE